LLSTNDFTVDDALLIWLLLKLTCVVLIVVSALSLPAARYSMLEFASFDWVAVF